MSVAMLAARGAQAQTTIVLWDRGIAAEINRQLVDDEACRTNPYDPFRPTCAGDDQGSGGNRVTTLDQFALFVYRYKDVNLKTKLRPGTELKFTADLLNLYKRKAEVWLTLRSRF
jgi:hypothetical protein